MNVKGLLAWAATIVVLSSLFGCYSSKSFVGDGTLSDSGFNSGMRYAIEFEPLDVNQSQVVVYTFSGAPPAWLQGYLSIEGNHQEIMAGTGLTFRLYGGNDSLLEHAEIMYPMDWSLSRLGRYDRALPFFGHRFRVDTKYKFVITVAAPTGGKPVMAMPVFHGDGLRIGP